MDEKFKELEEQITDIKSDVTWIKQYLENDPKTGRNGVIRQVEDLVHRLNKFEERLNELVQTSRLDKIIWGTAGGSVVIALEKIVTFITKQ